jgi:hypothetical protein
MGECGETFFHGLNIELVAVDDVKNSCFLAQVYLKRNPVA